MSDDLENCWGLLRVQTSVFVCFHCHYFNAKTRSIKFDRNLHHKYKILQI